MINISNGVKKIIPQSLKNIYHLFQAVLANVWFGFPSKKLKVIGVTGTNGKTTTVQMAAKILDEAGYKVAVASTINFRVGEKEWVNKSKFTTLSSWALQKFLKQAVSAGCEYAVLEVSSHSLDQNRVWGVKFDVSVLTNVTREHLDYHNTMQAYAKVKEKLFAMAEKNENSTSIVNLNSEFSANFLKHKAGEKYGYYTESQNLNLKAKNHSAKLKTVIAENIQLNIKHTQYSVQNTQFTLNLPGEFNIENALAATCVGISQGISLGQIAESLAKIKGIPGRMEYIENNLGLEIIVDYAVTPDSLEKLYDYIGEQKKQGTKIIAVFGSCGERDRGKRPIMGEIVARHADIAFVTNEDPYGEDPERIINEVFEGVVGEKITTEIPKYQYPISNIQQNPKSQNKKIQDTQYEIQDTKKEGTNAFRILDRREAIRTAIKIAKPGDVVVVTGKGAEEMMAVGSRRIPWNDPKVIREVLQGLELT